jgi:hypothetical protein
MELDVRIGKGSLGITIEDPYRLDLNMVAGRIRSLLDAEGQTQHDLDVEGLLPLMIRGVVGCEEGCPANAKDLVERGYKDFSLEYIEGGILTAQARTAAGTTLSLKLFPGF